MKRLGLTTSIAVIILAGCTSAAPSASPGSAGEIGGVATYQLEGSPATTTVEAVADAAGVSGTAVTETGEGTHTVRLACATRNGDVWVLGGTTDQTTFPGEKAGDWSAVMVKDGSPQQIGIWFSDDPSAASDCAAWLALNDFSTIDPSNFHPVESGTLVPPPALAP